MSALEISAIVASNNTKYDIKDSTARDQISGKVKIAIGDAMDFRPSDLSVCKISVQKYAELVKNNQTNDACLYVVSSEMQDAYGSRIINVGTPDADTDAATKGYVDAAVAGVDVTGQLTNYYTKSETSSKTQIQNALTNYYTKSETSSKTQIQNALTNYYTKSQTDALSTSFRSGLALSSDVQTKFSSLGLNYVKADKKIYLKVDGQNKATDFVDVTDFVKDGMLSAARLDAATNKLVLTFNTDGYSTPISVDMSKFVDDYSEQISQMESDISDLSTAVKNKSSVTIRTWAD